MNAYALKTLFHPFESGDLPLPEEHARVLFLGAEPGFRPPEGFPNKIAAVQGFRPDFLKLASELREVSPTAAGDGYEIALVLIGRHRGENELRIADCFDRTGDGALIVVAGAKDDGIASLRKRIEALVPLEGSLPKHHGIAFWLKRPADAATISHILRTENPESLIDGRFHAASGMFSHDRIDAGSRLLVEALPSDVKGAVADFCAGWGYISASLLERFPAVNSLALYEADHASLEAAKLNVRSERPLSFHWQDLVVEPVAGPYDAIVMNPPFHQGRAADPAIGQALIQAAAKALKKGGRLFMVANRNLPYEAALAAAFTRVVELGNDRQFKLFEARR